MAATAWSGPRWRLPALVAFVVAAAVSWPAAAWGNQFLAAPGAQYTFNGRSASQMVSGDFNNDGISDLAIATTSAGQDGGQGELWVLLGSASAPPTKPGGPVARFTGFTPTPAWPIEVGPPSQGLVEGDFNGDGKLDLAYEASMGGGLTILLGNGSGGFTAAGPPIYVAGSLAVGQFTAGEPDEIAVLEGSQIQVIGETGTNQFGVVATSSPSIPDVEYSGQIAAGRFASSSVVDLAALDDSTGNVSILLGNGKSDFKLSPTSPVDTGVNGGACAPGACLYSADSIAAGNFSSSGYSDLAVGTADGRVAVLLAKGDAAGDFAPATGSPYTVDPSGGAVDSLVTAPFSQNSTLDGIATADYFQGGCGGPCTIPSDSVGVLDPTGSGALTPAQGSPYDDGGVTVAAAAGDFNGDGLPDLAFDDSNDCQGDGIGVMINQGSAGGTPSTGVYPADNCQIPTPTVTLGQPTGVSLHGATLNGTVENNYQTLTGCMFQYGETSVTGATGFVGMAVLARLLERTERHALVLVRAGSQAEADARVGGVMASLFDDPARYAGRVRAVCGDLTAPGLGLGAEGELIAEEVGEIIHGAASVAFDMPLAESRAINVQGTRRVLELAEACAARGAGLRRLTYVSTAYVAGDRRGRALETELHVGQRFRNAYEQSKHEAESLVHGVRERLPITVVRPSIVVGERGTGWTASFNVIYGPLRAFAAGTYPIIPGRRGAVVDVVTVDHLADAILALSASEAAAGQTFHVVGGEHATTLWELTRLAARRFDRPTPRLVPPRIYRTFLHPLMLRRADAQTRKRLERSEVYFPYFSLDLRFDDRDARALLDPLGIRATPIVEYFDALIDFAEAARWGRAPIGRARARARVGLRVA